jgi:acyl carrier protein
MTRDDITAVLIDELGLIAPETDPNRLDPNAELREELDIDSIDFLNLVTALTERLAIDIPEVDYPNLTTFNDAVEYLAQRLAIAE